MTLDYVKKRDGKKVEFKSEKIKNAVNKAAAAVDQDNSQIAEEITAEVLSYLKIFFKDGGTLEVEQIQDLVEKVLIEKGYAEIAKAYILYREQHSKLRDSKKLFADAVNIMDDYLDRSDWKVNENSNMSYSLQGLNNFIASEVTGQYWLQEIYPQETAKLHSSGDLHIHDLGNLSVYCCGWDLEELLRTGFRGVPTKIESAPPKHLKTALGQIVNFMYTLQGECYSADTEVLTVEGWKYFYELNKRDKVCTLNPETDKIEYQKPLRYIEKNYEGKMLHFSQRSLDMMVTPDHKLLVEQYAPHMEDNYYKKFVLAKNFNPNSNFIPKQGEWEGEVKKYFILPPLKIEVYQYCGDNYVEKTLEVPKIKMNSWLAFFGFWIAEGSAHERKRKMEKRSDYSEYIITITQNENQNAAELKELLAELPFEYHISRSRKVNGPDKLNFRINSKQLYSYLKKFGHSGDKYIPEEIKALDKSQLEVLFNWMMKGDGYIANGNYEYYTKSKRLADDVQEIMTKLGYCANIYIKTKDKFKWYVISRLATKMHKVASNNINEVEYSGKVYCVEVPNQTLLVRRNGKSVWGGNCAGAQAFSNFDTYLAPFIAYDGLNYEEVKQAMQEFLFNMNVPTRVGFQTPFTNITMDLEVPNYLKDQAVIIGGQYQEKCYGEFQQEMDMLNRAFAELMMEGDAKGRMFSFPIPTYNITEDFEWENEKLDPVWEMTAKFGIPYFSNFINSDMDPEDARSMCCRLRLDNKELRKRGGGLFGANPLTGSIGVVTLNMPRIGYQAQDKEEFMERVYYLMDQAKESLEVKRRVLETLTEQGLYPYAKFYLRDIKKRFDQYWKNHFNTIGLNGMNEALLNFMGKDISTPEGQHFSEQIMEKMRERLQQYQEETGNMYNLEATPAEGTAYRFARLDREKFGNQITAANQEQVVKEDADPYYTNSTQLPVGLTDDIFTALELQDELQSLYTGGCIEKGNKVLTNKGAIKIEKIVRDYENLKPIKALSYNAKEDRSEWDLITDAMSIDVSKNNKIRVTAEKGLDITTSDWHPFFVLEKISVKDKCPICGEKVKGTKSFSTHTRYNPECRKKYKTMFKFKVVEKRADELNIGDYILQNSENLYPEKESLLDNDLMWLFGYFIGDGSISEYEDNRGGNHLKKYKLRFNDEHLSNLEKAKKVINNKFNTDINIMKNDKRSKKLYELATTMYSVNEYFLKYGFFSGEKCYEVNIPEQVKANITKNNVYSLLSGLIDSDGHINKKNGDIEYYTVSEELADDIVEILSTAGIMVSKEDKPSKRKNEIDGFRIRVPAQQATKIKNKLTITNDADFIKDKLSLRKRRQLPVVRVKKTSKIEVEDNKFYDLTTEKNHNYLAGNSTMVFIHNTVFHGFLGEKIDSIKATKKLIKRIAENFKLPYYTLTPSFSICPVHGYLPGEHEYCPKCEAEAVAEENNSKNLKAESEVE